MLQQVSEKLLGQFVESLEAKLAAPAASAASAESPASQAEPQVAAPDAAPIDLLELAGGQTVKRYAPAVAALFAAAAAVFAVGRWLLGRRVERDRR